MPKNRKSVYEEGEFPEDDEEEIEEWEAIDEEKARAQPEGTYIGKQLTSSQYDPYRGSLEESQEPIQLAEESNVTSFDNELKKQEELLAGLEQKAERKRQVKDVKKKIRRIKYAPAIEAGEKVKDVAGAILGKGATMIKEAKAKAKTPEGRARRAQTKTKIRRVAKGMMGAIGGEQPAGKQPAGKKQLPGFMGDLLGNGKKTNLLGGDQPPKILQDSGSGGMGLLSGGGDLLGGGRKPNILNENFGSGLLSGDILGGATGKRRAPKKRKKKKKRGRKK